jgi:Putative transposase
VVPGGGIAPDGTRWIACRPGFFLPVRVLSRVFRRLFLEQLDHAYTTGQLQFTGTLATLHEPQAFARYLAPLRQSEWIVYAKKPFGSAQRVLDYLGRYTHRVAISNNRLLSMDDEQVTFRWKDYRQHDKQKRMILTPTEFIRRFLLHVLPSGFQRIRHFGFLGNRYRQAKLDMCRHLLAMAPVSSVPPLRLDYRDRYEQLTGKSLRVCPVCAHGQIARVETLPARARVPVPGWDSS